MKCHSYSCVTGKRVFETAVLIKTPKDEIPDKGFKECCYLNYVFADSNSNDDYKNDYHGFFHQKQANNETCDFILRNVDTNTDYALNNSTYGEFKAFGSITSNVKLTQFILSWKKVLTLLGEGSFQIIKSINVSGLSYEVKSNTYILKQFSNFIADKTIRIDITQDGKLVKLGIDFKNSGFKTTLRTVGFFGHKEREYTQDNLVFSNNEKEEQISSIVENKYKLQINKVPECITNDLFDFILFGNEIFVNDYNIVNHSYYEKQPVRLDSNSGTEYFKYSRNAQINLTFVDRYKLERKINY
jgi:hypothetical protein